MTAMDFFGHNMAILSFKLESNNITQEEFNVELYNLFQQAKELEKQQIIESYSIGFNDGCSYMFDGKTEYKDLEEYYNETYGGQNNEQ